MGDEGTSVRAKICGIRSEADLCKAVSSGADAVGFISGVTHLSEDALGPELARRLCALVPPFVNRVLVTHLEEADRIIELAELIGVDTIQVHGEVSDETAVRVRSGWRGGITRVLHVEAGLEVHDAKRVAATADAVHLDTRTAERLGGTGKTHDWQLSAKLVAALRADGTPAVLAGGLDDRNVAAAIATVTPYAVDVNSGVDDANGDKDAAKVAAFVKAAHAATVAPLRPAGTV